MTSKLAALAGDFCVLSGLVFITLLRLIRYFAHAASVYFLGGYRRINDSFKSSNHVSHVIVGFAKKRCDCFKRLKSLLF